MKASLKFMVYFGLTISFLSFGGTVTLTRADDDFDSVSSDSVNKMKWEQIVGVGGPADPKDVGGFRGGAGPWTAQRGRVVVDLSSGKMKFRVNGLVLAFQPPHPSPEPVPTPFPIIGTTGLVTQVKGTLVCDAASPTALPDSFVDTPAVPISPQGNAQFEGVVSIPFACLATPQRLAFLIRLVEFESPLFDHWIAHGAVRRP